jgi:hypothetical protein
LVEMAEEGSSARRDPSSAGRTLTQVVVVATPKTGTFLLCSKAETFYFGLTQNSGLVDIDPLVRVKGSEQECTKSGLKLCGIDRERVHKDSGLAGYRPALPFKSC